MRRRRCQRVLNSLNDLREDGVVNVGHVDEQTPHGLLRLLRRARFREVLAYRHYEVHNVRRDLAQRLVFPQEGENRENQRRHHLVLYLEEIDQLHQNVVVQKVWTEHKR